MKGKDNLTDTALKRLQKLDISKEVSQSDGLGLSVRARPSDSGELNNVSNRRQAYKPHKVSDWQLSRFVIG